MNKTMANKILSEGIDYPGECYKANNGSNEIVQLKKHYAGATMWQTCAQVCTDGCGKIKSSTHQGITAMGPKINAQVHTYIVLPTDNNNNVRIGDLGIVIDTETNKSVYVIYAERGPAGKIGEMSIAVFDKLGLKYKNSKHQFYGYNNKDRFITIMFPKSGKKYGYDYDKLPKNYDEISSNGSEALLDFYYAREHTRLDPLEL